ncbi:MAG: MATE family efflux transporter [Bacteroidota bacterium]
MKTSLSLKHILAVAFPVMIGMFVQFTVSITDSAFMNRVSTVDFNAAGNAGMLYITFYMVAMGVSNGLQVLVARRDGEGNYKQAGVLFRHALFFLFLFSIFLFFLLQTGNYFFVDQAVEDAETAESMRKFLYWRSFGYFFSVTTLAIHGFYSGIARTNILMYSTVTVALLNVVLDYGLIFGNLGLPKWGIEGAAIATVLSEAAGFIFSAAYLLSDKKTGKYRIKEKVRIKWNEITGLLKVSWPLMIQGFLSVGTWTVYFFFIEKMGRESLEISQVIRNFYFIALIPVLGLGTATRTFVSNLMAQEKKEEIIPSVVKITIISFVATFIFVQPNLFYPHHVVPVIGTNDVLLEDTVFTLQLVTGAMLLMAIVMPLLNMISGSGDTNTSFYIELLSITTYLIMAYLLTIPFRQEIWTVWSLEYLYFFVMGIASIYYIRKGKWRHIKI